LERRPPQVAVPAAVLAFVAEQATFDTYLHALDLVDARIEQLERAVRQPTKGRGVSWSRGCAACAASTR
jgi:hypothetical protein